MNILVTGAAGFIASHLIKKLLSEKYQVIGIDNFDPFYSRHIKEENLDENQHPKYTFYEGDIRNEALLAEIFQGSKVDLVIHLAAKAGVRPSMEDPVGYSSNNVEGTTILLETMRLNGISTIIFGSSSSVYGENTPVPFKETAELNSIISMYALTKKAGEEVMQLYHSVYGFSVLCLRFFTVYGPGQRPDLAIRKFVNAIEKGDTITVYGDGSTGRDYTFVEDIVSGILASVNYLKTNKEVFEVINLGNSSPVLLSELIETIESVLSKEALKKYETIPLGDVPITYADITKAKQMLGYKPKTSLKVGIEAFYKWYKNQNHG